jgi:PKHD-type hydroxylase
MTLILERVLQDEDLETLRKGLADAPWRDGKATAGPAARSVKANLQADGEDKKVQALERFVLDALWRHPMFEIAARPKRVSRLLLSKYEPGMTYGAHTDDALMGPRDNKLRTDLAFTIFLADTESYEGGALVVESALGEQAIRLNAGDAILYAAGSIHHVAPVTRGARLAAVGWVQSVVAEESKRDILFDLSVTRSRLAEAGVGREEVLRLDKAVSNLLRLWAQP